MKNEIILKHSGRNFEVEDIALIIEMTKMYPGLSRSELAATICELLGWVMHNGKPKLTQCSEYLCYLENEGVIKLPKLSATGVRHKKDIAQKRILPEDTDTSEITECREISLSVVRPGKDLSRWRGYLSNYHVLGDPNVYGSQLRYMINMDERNLGCLLFSGSSWSLEPRESWINWTSEEKKEHLHLIINNSRFLLLPWVKVKNLASRALSMAARRIQKDWLEYYCYTPVLLETFVDYPYKGTSYKAANWIYLGETKGRGRNDRNKEYALTQKSIYVLPLQKDFRAVLRGEKPFKAVNPDDE